MTSARTEARIEPQRGGNASFVLTLWTDDQDLARYADLAGVDRIGPDLERLGKRERQKGTELWQTTHREDCLPQLRSRVVKGELFARTNPPHGDWPTEAARLIAAGVEVLMLPAFDRAAEVRSALQVVAGRANLVPLVETPAALEDVPALAALEPLTDVHFGLNDLALGMGLGDRFRVLTLPQLERATALLSAAGIRVGVGGIGRPRDTQLPIPSDLIYAQYPRLGARGALIARSFFRGLNPGAEKLGRAVTDARRRLEDWYRASPGELRRARTELGRRCAARDSRREKRGGRTVR